jgi:hypothetical protein
VATTSHSAQNESRALFFAGSFLQAVINSTHAATIGVRGMENFMPLFYHKKNMPQDILHRFWGSR